jgi:hypothetical protein
VDVDDVGGEAGDGLSEVAARARRPHKLRGQQRPPQRAEAGDGIAGHLEELDLVATLAEQGRLLVDHAVLTARGIGAVAVVDHQHAHR